MSLHLYFARRYLRAFGLIAGVMALCVLLIDTVEQLRRISGNGAGLRDALELALYHAPGTLYEIVPLIAVLSGVSLVAGLVRNSELVVARAAGRSVLVCFMAPMLVALVIGYVVLLVLNPFAAASAKRYAQLSAVYLTDAVPDTLSVSAEGLWLREGAETGQTVIRAARAEADGSALHEVSVFFFAPEGGLIRRAEARRAELRPGNWRLRDVKSWPIAGRTNPEAAATFSAVIDLPTQMTPERIRGGSGAPDKIGFWNLPDHVRSLSAAGLSVRRHLVWYHSELTRPLFLMALVMIAAALSARHVRAGHVGVAVISSVLIGFALFYVRNFAQILGDNGQIPVLAAAWVSPVATLMIGLAIVLQADSG